MMPVLSKFQAVTQQGDSVAPSGIAEQLADLGLRVRPSLPASVTVTVTPLFNRIAVQVDSAEIIAGTTIEGFVDYQKDGIWRQGTELRKRYDADEYYANCFNLREATAYPVRVTLRLRDAAGVMVREYVQHYSTTTLSSATPQSSETIFYVDTVNGTTSGGGGTGTLANPFKWFNDRSWVAGDTIRVINGNMAGATTAQSRIRNRAGTATNWIKIEPCPAELLPGGADPRIHNEKALDGPWTDEGGGAFSMDITSLLASPTGDTLGLVYDSTVGEHLYPFKSRANFDAAAIGDGTGYWIDNSDSTNPAYADGTDVLYVRLASGIEPTSGQLKAARGNGLFIQSTKYLVIDGLTVEYCGTRSQSNGSMGGAGIRFDDQETGVSLDYVVTRNCSFDHNTYDITFVDVTGAGVNRTLIEDNEFTFEGPWPHFFGGFDYIAGSAPYVQTDSWSHAKSSAWETGAINATGSHNGVTTRRNTCTGKQYIIASGSNGDGTNAKHFHSEDDYVTECWDDGLGDIGENSEMINAAFIRPRVVDAITLMSLAPYNAGPVWVISPSIDGFIHYPLKLGDQAASADDSHGPKIIVNMSAKAKGDTSNEIFGCQYLLGGHSGLEVYNAVYHSYQSGGVGDDLYWIQQTNDTPANYNVETPNAWINCLFFVESNGVTLTPKIRWRSSGGTLTDYDTFDDANTGIGTADTQFTDCEGTYSVDGDPEPFPTTVAAGLNAAIMTKSVAVRGITSLATVGSGGLAIGSFSVRDAY